MSNLSVLPAPPPSRDRLRAARVATALTTTVIMAASLLHAPAARASVQMDIEPPPVQKVPAVAVEAVPPGVTPAGAPMTDAAEKPAPTWPAAGTALVDVPNQGAPPVQAGDLPVWLGSEDAEANRGAAAAVGSVEVRVLDRTATDRAGVRGVLFRITPESGTEGAEVDVTVNYGRFATGYGADWGSRLRLVRLPECALTTPEDSKCVGTPLPSINDVAEKTVAASVPVAAETLVAVSAGASGPAGSYAATPLQSSSTWSAGGNSGAFNWSYPMRVPPAPGDLAPSVGLSYSSQSVDGRHAASNNQPSMVGEGFEATVGGFIERRYRSCAKDMDGSANNDDETGDLCWETDNAVLSLNGSSGELIFNSAENRWHLRGDDGSRIERKLGASNGDQGDAGAQGDQGEHWVVTTTEGTEYWFGLHRLPGWAANDPVTNSTLTAPVFGNDPDEPCNQSAFGNSDCVQAWRWNLDYVVDLHGNSISYWYEKETNKYGRNLDPDDDASYDRGSWLDHIDYGTRRITGTDSVLDGPAPLRVQLGTGDRCLSACGNHDESHWPDTPWEAECTGSSCPDNFTPTFWSTRRLSTVTTQVRSGSGYANVERWTLGQTFPDPGDGTRAGLWLSKISHAGLVGGTTTVPDIEFTGIQLANRVDTIDHSPAMNWWRIAKIRNESGGTISVNYLPEDCVAGQTPTPHTNTRRCYPVRWQPEGYPGLVTDWFHKYVVDTIHETDQTGGMGPQGSPAVDYKYHYLDGAAWHYTEDDGLIDKASKTWSDYRGYGRVGVTTGDPGEQTYTETRYFRGMHGDRLSPSGTRTVTIDGITDSDWYAGTVRESKTFNGPGGPVVARQTSEPWASPATATRTLNGQTVTARFTRVATTRDYTTLDGGRGERVTRITTTFDNLGMPTAVDDFGEEGVEGDEQCTKTDFTPRNDAIWLMNRPHRIQSYAVKCANTGGSLTEADVIGETRTWYDSATAFETAPTRGLATRIESMSAWNSGAPTFSTIRRAQYDAHGREKTTWDAMNFASTTTYTPETGGPVTAVTVTNPLSHKVTVTLNPAWGLATSTVDPNDKRTDLAYDGLGRLTSVWLPNREKATDTANMTYGYHLRTDAPSAVTTSQLNAAGDYVTSYALYDGMLRPRQTQSPSPQGGRLLTDTFYDSAGRLSRTYGSYHTAGDPGTSLETATEAEFVPAQTRTLYDGAGREIASIFLPFAVERWRTTTAYGGDRVDVTPPTGGTATSTITDARERTVALRQYHGPAPTPGTAGSWDATTFEYNRKGLLSSVTDPVGNDWTYAYDIRGRQITSNDPDRGSTQFTYDNAGRITSTTDARGKKLFTIYDALNRKWVVYENQLGGPMRAQWEYDTLAKGYLTRSTSIVNGVGYVTQVNGYTSLYQPTRSTVNIPSSEDGLAGNYIYDYSWNVDGSPETVALPDTNSDLPPETLTFGYDSLGLPTTVQASSAGATSYYVPETTYNAFGWISQITLDRDHVVGGHVWQTFTHEFDTGRLTGLKTDRGTAPQTLSDLQYEYDKAGNVIKTSDTVPAPVGDTQCYRYDYLRRLTEAWTPASANCAAAPSVAGLGGPAQYWHSWEFDKVGNRVKQVVHNPGGDATTNYSYPPAGAARPHTLTSTSGATTGSYTYDATGNTLTRPTAGSGTQTLTWNPEGRLHTSTDSSGTTAYVYDADGNRLIRRDPTGSTLYLPGQEVRYTTATGATSCTRYYSHAGRTVASRTAAGVTWLAGDHQGTAQVAVDSGTSQQATIRRYNPYGVARGNTLGWPNDKGFVGGTMDNTGLTHLGAREYDPLIGRFISVDPIMDLADPQQMHGYAYANNTPVTLSDPSGLYVTGDNEGNLKAYKKPGGGHNIRDQRLTKKAGPTSIAAADQNIETGVGNDPREVARLTFLATFTEDHYACRGSSNGANCDSLRRAVAKGKMDPNEAAVVALCGGNAQCMETFYSTGGDLETLLTILGFVPGVGEFADLASVALALSRGDKEGAALSAAAMIPIFGWAAGAKRLHKLSKACSFSADTPVLMADGTTKPIGELRVGDVVMAADPETGKRGPREVTHVWVHDDELVDLDLDNGETVTTTEDHPFWNDTDQQWQQAQHLTPGDNLLTPSGRIAVAGLDWDTIQRGPAYNLTVTDIHTYYVLAGNTPVLVHNDGGDDGILGRGDLTPEQLKNLNRYEKKLPAGAESTVITRGANGAVQFEAKVPGRVPGSYANYMKTVDLAGNTIGYTKTTIVPDGSVAHVKDKMC